MTYVWIRFRIYHMKSR